MIGWISSILSTTTRKNSASLRSCKAFSATYFSRSVGSVRRLTSTRSTWVSIVSTQGGSSPRRPRSSRSCAVKAVPLLSRGSRSSAMPCAVSDDVEWALTRAGLFTNPPGSFLLTGNHCPPAVHRDQGHRASGAIVISHRSEICVGGAKVNVASLLPHPEEPAQQASRRMKARSRPRPSFETVAARPPQDGERCCAIAKLFRLDVRSLHDRPPLFGLG